MSLEALNKRIKTTTDLRDIVSTMKMLSSVSIGPYEKALASLKEYGKTVQDAFLGFVLNDATDFMPRIPKNQTPKVLMILVGTDNGLVGRFNRDIFAKAQEYIKEKNLKSTDILYLCVGKRIGLITENNVGEALKGAYAISNSLKEIASIASTLLLKVNELLTHVAISEVLVFHNYKETATPQRPMMQQLMPLPYDFIAKLKQKKWEGRSSPQTSGDKLELFSALVHEYLTVILAGSLTASLAAEHYARMVNMQQAEKNIDKSLEEMNLTYQQARQTDITDELIDIVSGAEAMKTKKFKKVTYKNITDDLTNGKKKAKKVRSK